MPRLRRKLGNRTSSVNDSYVIRAGFRVPDRCRDASCHLRPSDATHSEEPRQPHTIGTAGASEQFGDSAQSTANKEGPLESEDEEEGEFLEALKGLVDGALKLLGADMGVGTWLISGLRKRGPVDSFADSMAIFANRRMSALLDALSPREAAYAFARRLRQHVQAHDATTGALGIRAGRKRTGSKTNANLHNENERGDAAASHEGEELKEQDFQVVRLWRQWKRSGGFWPAQMPDPDDNVFDGPDGTEKFLDKLDEGTHSFLREISRDILETALPQDAEELRSACEAAAGNDTARGGGGSKGSGGDSSRSIIETANRLAQLKSGVLEIMLCEALTQEVVGRSCRPAKLWQFVLQLIRPDAKLSPASRDTKHPEAFSLVAGTLERSDRTPSGTLRTELMQGLVKMPQGTRDREDFSGSRGSTYPSGASEMLQPSSDDLGGGQEANAQVYGSSTLGRSDAVDSARWSKIDPGIEEGDANDGHRLQWSAPSMSSTRGKAGGARDILNVTFPKHSSLRLVGGEKDKSYEDLEDHALDEVGKWLQKVVDNVPLGNACLAKSWIPDRVGAARAFARRPTNLVLVLSIVDAAKSIFETAGNTDKRKASGKANSRAGRPRNVGEGDCSHDAPMTSEASEDNPARSSGSEKLQARGPDEGRIPRRRQRARDRRHTPGWQAWDARRELLFGMDVGVAALHVGRSLLGQETLELFDVMLKAVSLEYYSVEAMVRDEAFRALRKCSDKGAPNMLQKVKPRSIRPILCVSSQMRMLRALKKAGLDFSKSLGDGPRKQALSRRFKSYSWIFTGSLIEQLVAMRIEDATRNRTISTSLDPPVSGRDDKQLLMGVSGFRESQEGASRATNEAKRRESRLCQSDIMREMTAGCGSSKDLLVKVVGSWLPAVLAADREADIRET